jgi:hypothetical protein
MKNNLPNPLSKISKWTLLLMLFCVSNNTFSQLYPVSLDQRVKNAQVIFEGKVLNSVSFWDEKHANIYTSNLVEVYKVFKGVLMATNVEVVTEGGIVGMEKESVSHTLELKVGDVGIFTAISCTIKPSKNPGLMSLKTYADMQGFIKYDQSYSFASDPFNRYNSISKALYPEIMKFTKQDFKTIKKADFNIK